MTHVLSHLVGLAGFAAALWLSGRVLLAYLGEVGRLGHLASFCLGLAGWISALFVLAAAGHLDPRGLLAGAVLVMVLAIPARKRILKRAGAAEETRRPSTAELLYFVFLGGSLALTFFLAISPQVSWDAAVYHLTLPRLYLENGGFRPVPMNVYSNWPLATELLYAAAMAVSDYMLAKAVHFGFGLLVVYALFVALAERGRLAGALAASFFLANAVVAFELRVAYVDLAHAFFFLSGFIFLDRALEARDGTVPGFLLLSGLSCGLMAGVKVTGVLGAAVIGALWVPRLFSSSGRRLFATRFALPVLALWAPWLVKSFVVTGNPFYPFLHARLGGPDWSAALAERFSAWQSSIGMGRGALDYLLLPVRVVLEGGRGYEHFDGEISPFWLVLVPLAAVAGRRDPLVRRALAAAGLFFAVWAASSQQMRFLIPALALLALAGAAALTGLLERGPRRLRLGGPLLAVAALLLATVHGPFLAGGYRTFLAFLGHEGDLALTVVPEHLRYVNENLPEDSLLLFVNTNLGFSCRREYLADSFFEASQIADWLGDAASAAEVRRRLDGRGVTHLVVDARPRVRDFPPALGELLNDPGRVRVLFRSSDGRYAVLELVAGG